MSSPGGGKCPLSGPGCLFRGHIGWCGTVLNTGHYTDIARGPKEVWREVLLVISSRVGNFMFGKITTYNATSSIFELQWCAIYGIKLPTLNK